MLTADHVYARRSKGALKLTKLTPERRKAGLHLATQFYEIAQAHVQGTRAELNEAWRAVEVAARDRKLGEGLKKLITDGLEFEVIVEEDPAVLRKVVFERATEARKTLAEDARFDADALLADVALERGLDVQVLARGLYGDLKGAHVLTAVNSKPPDVLMESYDLEQARAVMLRAVRVRARIKGASPDAIRVLFRKLKFRRLLYSVTREPTGTYVIDIDGPFSLFDSVTKYGLSLAIALNAITACGRWSIEAEVRWGKKRDPLTFTLSGARREHPADPEERVRDEVQELIDRFNTRDRSAWTVASADEILDLPGIGLCVPDLAFAHDKTGEVVLLEVMGFWSRDAVWRRVELVQAGLGVKILFAVSSRLRVSEAVLPDNLPGALYVYKGKMSPKQIEDRLAQLVTR